MINIIIAHSHPAFIMILQNILRSYQSLHVISKVSNAASLLQAITLLKPDVIIADIALPGMDGVTTLQKIAAGKHPPKVILSWKPRHLPVLKEALATGCTGCIAHDADPEYYPVAIKEVMKGKTFYCTNTEKIIEAHIKKRAGVAVSNKPLTNTHRLVLYCMSQGFTNKQTARSTGLSKETVDTYRKYLNKLIGSRSIEAFINFMKENGDYEW